MTHAPETGTENLHQKTGTIFQTQFFLYQVKLEAKFMD